MNERLAPQAGEWIDRTQPIRFRFEGSEYLGFVGDTISTALWAKRRPHSGVAVLSIIVLGASSVWLISTAMEWLKTAERPISERMSRPLMREGVKKLENAA